MPIGVEKETSISVDLTTIEEAIDVVDANVDQLLIDVATTDGKADQILLDISTTDGKADQLLLDVATVDGKADQLLLDVATVDGKSDELLDYARIICGVCPDDTSTSTTIKLASNASAVDGAYDPAVVIITKGTGAGQARQIFQYTGSTRIGYVNRDWKVIPDETSEYCIMFNHGNSHVNEGVAQAGGASTITLNALASSQNNVYLGQMVFIAAGTGADQARMCVGYNGTTKVLTVDSPWIVQPDNTSIYAMYPWPGFVFGRPGVNESANVLIGDVIGNKNDYVGVPYDFGVASIIGHLNTAYYHIHGQSFVYPNKANPVTIQSAAGAWAATGTITEVIPAGALDAAAFDLHWINIQDISGNCSFVVDIFSGLAGAEVLIGSTRGWRSSNFISEGAKRIQIPQQPAGTRISCRLSDSTSGQITVGVSSEGHYYAI